MTKSVLAPAMLVSVFAIVATFVAPTMAHAEESTADQQANQSQESQPAAEEQSKKYVVQRGDYLSAIAKQHDVTWPSIFEVNQIISNPDIIFAGMELTIPAHDVPLTRIVPQESSLTIPANYQPKVATTKPAVGSAKPAAPAAAVTTVPGVPGLSSVLGKPYVRGGSSPSVGFDCSGLTQFLAAQKGVSVPRTSSGQYQALRKISLGEAWAGDIVVFNLGHVGTYLGGGQVVHALNPAQGIRVENLQTAIRYNGFLSVVAVGH